MTYLGAAPTTTASRKSQVTYRYLMTAGQSVISGSDLNNNTLSCDPLDTEIFMNGLKLDSTDTTITATQVTLAVPAAAGDEIEVVAYRTFESADHYDKSTSDTRYVNAAGDTMSGDLTIDTNTFHVDVADNRVGVGIATPLRKLHIKENAAAGEGILLTNEYNQAGTYSDLKWAWKGSPGNESYGSGLRFRQVDTTHGGQLEFYTDSASGTYTKQMQITENGEVTKPNQPRFRAHTTSNTDITTAATIVYNATTLNVGSHYNTSNGRFTAPVAGLYTFTSVHYHNYGTAGEVRLSLFKNGSELENSRNSRSTSHNYYDRIRLTTELELAANDYVYITGQGIGGGQLHTSNGLGYSDFFGHLVG